MKSKAFRVRASRRRAASSVNWVASMFVTIMALWGSRLTYSMTNESLPWTRISIARRMASTTTWEGWPAISG